MRVGRAAVVVAAFLAATASADPPERVRVEASGSFALSPHPATSIVVEPDGAAVVRQRVRPDPEPRTVLELRLTDAEMNELRSKVVASRFFDEWTRGDAGTDMRTWSV